MTAGAPVHGWIQKVDSSGLEPLVVEAEQELDTAGIVAEELAHLGYPLPIEVGKSRFQGIDDRTRRILADKGLTSFTEAHYRAAVRQAAAGGSLLHLRGWARRPTHFGAGGHYSSTRTWLRVHRLLTPVLARDE
jgi:hypothetical protein